MLFAKEGSIYKLPKPGSVMKFTNHKNKLERPFIVYADTECSLIKNNDDKKIHKHVVNSCCFYFVCTYDSSKNKLWSNSGPDCLKLLVLELHDLADKCIAEMKVNLDIEMTKADKNNFYNAKECCVCGGCFDDAKNYKVRDHDHRTGKYRGAAHNKCNINYFNNRYLPVVFHNLRGYDSHLIIKQLHEISKTFCNKPEIGVIPNSYEKFMSFAILVL